MPFFLQLCARACIFCKLWLVDGGVWSIRRSAFHTCSVRQSCQSSVCRPCKCDLNSRHSCWLMLLCMCRNSSWQRGDNWTSSPAEPSNCQHVLFKLAGSQRLIQDVRTMLYIVRTKLQLQMTSEWMLFHTTMTTRHNVCKSVGVCDPLDAACGRRSVPRQPSNYRQLPPDFRLPARGKRVQWQPPDYRLPSSVVIFRPPSCSFHLASLTSYRTVARYFLFAAALSRFSSIP